LAQELDEQPLALGHAQVERDQPLAAALHGPPERVAVDLPGAPRAQGVELAGRLDLDDLGAEVGQHPAGERPRDEGPHLDDAQPRERLPLVRYFDHARMHLALDRTQKDADVYAENASRDTDPPGRGAVATTSQQEEESRPFRREDLPVFNQNRM